MHSSEKLSTGEQNATKGGPLHCRQFDVEFAVAGKPQPQPSTGLLRASAFNERLANAARRTTSSSEGIFSSDSCNRAFPDFYGYLFSLFIIALHFIVSHSTGVIFSSASDSVSSTLVPMLACVRRTSVLARRDFDRIAMTRMSRLDADWMQLPDLGAGSTDAMNAELSAQVARVAELLSALKLWQSRHSALADELEDVRGEARRRSQQTLEPQKLFRSRSAEQESKSESWLRRRAPPSLPRLKLASAQVYLSGEQVCEGLESRVRLSGEQPPRIMQLPHIIQSRPRDELPMMSSSAPSSPTEAAPTATFPKSATMALGASSGQAASIKSRGAFYTDPRLKLLHVSIRRCSRDIRFLESAVRAWERGCLELEAELAESKAGVN